MYYPKAYEKIDKEKIEQDIRKDGFSPMLYSDGPGHVYERHSHAETKLLVFLSGSMDVTVNSEIFHCEPGDKLVIPGNTIHAAIVGPSGCSFYWSEKII